MSLLKRVGSLHEMGLVSSYLGYGESTVSTSKSSEDVLSPRPIFEALWDELECPILDIGERRGNTDYIDFIRETELTAPIMKGTDIYGRPFFCLRITIEHEGVSRPCYRTFFRRYTDDSSHRWAMAVIIGEFYPEEAFYALYNQVQELIAKLVRTGTYVYDQKLDGVSSGVAVGSVFRLA